MLLELRRVDGNDACADCRAPGEAGGECVRADSEGCPLLLGSDG